MQKKYKIIHVITRLDKGVQQKIQSLLFWEQIRKNIRSYWSRNQLMIPDGFLVLPRNPEELAKYIQILLEDEEKRKKMGWAGNDVAMIFSEEIMVKRIIKLYKELLAKKIFLRVLNQRSNTDVSLAF